MLTDAIRDAAAGDAALTELGLRMRYHLAESGEEPASALATVTGLLRGKAAKRRGAILSFLWERCRAERWTPESIRQVFLSGEGYQGDSCHKCRRLANVPTGQAGWACECGSYNVLSWSCHMMPHDFPHFGPPAGLLHSIGSQIPYEQRGRH